MIPAAETILEGVSLLAAGYSIYQAKQYHDKEVHLAHQRHEAAMKLAREQHQKDLIETKRNYLLELFTNLEQHFQQLNADLIASSKEAERDMFDQRNQSFQTIILASSVMFSALSTAIVNGYLPSSSGAMLVVSFALTSSLSFAFLFLSMVISMELVMRASTFMYKRAKNQTNQLRNAIAETRNMMKKLRLGSRKQREANTPNSFGDPNTPRDDTPETPLTTSEEVSNKQASSRTVNIAATRSTDATSVGTSTTNVTSTSPYPYPPPLSITASMNANNSDRYSPPQAKQQQLSAVVSPFYSISRGLSSTSNATNSPSNHINSSDKSMSNQYSGLSQRKRGKASSPHGHRGIAALHEDDVREEWEKHEDEIVSYLKQREVIHNGVAVIDVGENSQDERKKSFQEFWTESCKFWAELSILFFYAGTVNLLLCTMIYMWAKFLYDYKSLLGALIGVSLIIFVLVLGIAGVVVLRLQRHHEHQLSLLLANQNNSRHNNLHDSQREEHRQRTLNRPSLDRQFSHASSTLPTSSRGGLSRQHSANSSLEYDGNLDEEDSIYPGGDDLKVDIEQGLQLPLASNRLTLPFSNHHYSQHDRASVSTTSSETSFHSNAIEMSNLSRNQHHLSNQQHQMSQSSSRHLSPLLLPTQIPSTRNPNSTRSRLSLDYSRSNNRDLQHQQQQQLDTIPEDTSI
jgi:hypothetical protein